MTIKTYAKSLYAWRKAAPQSAWQQLIKAFPRMSLQQIMTGPDFAARRNATPERAIRIEVAVAEIHRDDPTVPLISRGCVSAVCGGCKYWRDSPDGRASLDLGPEENAGGE